MVSEIEKIHFDRIITSPNLRAKQTADIDAKALSIPCDALHGLRELDHGDWEGKNLVKNKSMSYYQEGMISDDQWCRIEKLCEKQISSKQNPLK